MAKVVEYHPNKRIDELDGTEPLSELINQEITIADVKFVETSKYTVAIVTLNNGNRYRTVSTVLIKQLKDIKKLTDSGTAVLAKIAKKGRYLTFV
jgi:hypothetical protein